MRTLLSVVVLASTAVACSEDKKFNQAAPPADTSEQPLTDGIDGTDFVEDTGSGGEESLEDLLEDCGITQKQLDDPEHVLLDKEIKSWPKVVKGSKAAPLIGNVNFMVKVVTKVKIKATMSKTTTTTGFDIEAIPSAAQSQAEERVADKRGSQTAWSLDTAARQEMMAEEEDWSGIFCAVTAVKKTKTNKGGKSVEAEYEPALPMSLNPRATADRYESELGSERTFKVTAKVKKSNDPALRSGKEIEGTVRFVQVKPGLTLNAGSSGTVKVPADVAYRIEYDFGTEAQTAALGFNTSQTVFLSLKKKDMQAIVVDAGDEGKVVLSNLFEGID